MRASNTFGIQFIVRSNKAKNGTVLVYVRISVDGRRIEISLKKSIAPNDWDSLKGKAKGSRAEVKELNHYLEQVRSKLLGYYQELQIQDELITAERIKNLFLGLENNENTLGRLIDYHGQISISTLAPGTLKNYSTTEKYIKEFLKNQFHSSDLNLNKLNYKFLTDFEYFLRSRRPIDHQRPLTNNGVMKHIERFRKMVNLAVKLEWLDKDPFDKFQMKFNRVDRGFLSEAQLETIETKKLRIDRLVYVRDLFVFSCYTGLSYIDTVNLAPLNIAKGIDGEYWISTKRQKTDEPVRVPILPKAWELIEKYRNHPRSLEYGTIFPRISNQKLNSYLKELADICGIEQNLTFHLARHTFATTITLTNGVPMETVSKMLGHSKISTTQIYSKVIEQKISEDMTNLRNKMSNQPLLKIAK